LPAGSFPSGICTKYPVMDVLKFTMLPLWRQFRDAAAYPAVGRNLFNRLVRPDLTEIRIEK
jgi:hypothetical protein